MGKLLLLVLRKARNKLYKKDEEVLKNVLNGTYSYRWNLRGLSMKDISTSVAQVNCKREQNISYTHWPATLKILKPQGKPLFLCFFALSQWDCTHRSSIPGHAGNKNEKIKWELHRFFFFFLRKRNSVRNWNKWRRLAFSLAIEQTEVEDTRCMRCVCKVPEAPSVKEITLTLRAGWKFDFAVDYGTTKCVLCYKYVQFSSLSLLMS